MVADARCQFSLTSSLRACGVSILPDPYVRIDRHVKSCLLKTVMSCFRKGDKNDLRPPESERWCRKDHARCSRRRRAREERTTDHAGGCRSSGQRFGLVRQPVSRYRAAPSEPAQGSTDPRQPVRGPQLPTQKENDRHCIRRLVYYTSVARCEIMSLNDDRVSDNHYHTKGLSLWLRHRPHMVTNWPLGPVLSPPPTRC
jgi:hypothetical protein